MAQDDAVPAAPGAGPTSDRLQALLSRAAEEQLAEQRQVAALLADIRRVVAGIDEQLRRAHAEDRPGPDVPSLADALAPRVADLLVERLAATVAEQVAARLAAVQEDGERRLAAHVDDAVLALAEVLLRSRRRRAPSVPAEVVADLEPGPPALDPDEAVGRAPDSA